MSIDPIVYSFLKELGKNNNRGWFQENKETYYFALENVRNFVSNLVYELARIDPYISTDINAAKCLFRIYRDIRFSKDKTPYKTWFSAGISIDGRKLDGPEYYLHIEDGRSFVAAGYWKPHREHLRAIRQEIDYNGDELGKTLKDGGWTFESLDRDGKLKRSPAGYLDDNPYIEVLKLKSFIVLHRFANDELLGHDAVQNVVYICERMIPFKLFLHRAID